MQQEDQQEARGPALDVHKPVFFTSAGLIIAFVLWGAIFTENAGEVLGATLGFITDQFSWLFIGGVAIFLVFCIYLIVGPYAKIRLGPDDSRPDYSYGAWFAMLFSAGMGIGLLFWGVAEPIYHYVDAPREAGESLAAARDSMVLTYHHWGFGPWSVYAVLGLALAYFGFRHGLPLTVRSALFPLIGNKIYGPIGNLVDILAVLGTMIGVAVSLGLGVMQVNSGLNAAFGVESSITMQVILIGIITAAATVSVVLGLDKGIRRLSQINIVLAGALLLFVALAGPTVLIIAAYFENLGMYAQSFFETLFWSGTYDDADAQGWLGGWTLFYWAWWISWSPFVGMFIARISRGRTIREFTLGVLLVPSLVSFLWFTVMGNTAIQFQAEGVTDVYGAIEAADWDASVAMFEFLEAFPLATVTSVLTILVVIFFFVTSSDSGSFVIDILTSGGNPDPPVATRVFWAVSEGVVAAILLLAGGEAALDGLQAGAVSTGLPFTVVLLFVVIGLIKGMRTERSHYSLAQIAAGADPSERPKAVGAASEERNAAVAADDAEGR